MRRLIIILGVMFGALTYNLAQSTAHTGYMGDDVANAYYPVTLAMGQTIWVKAAATSGDLDTIIGLEDPDGNIVIENDDQDSQTRDSFFSYTATVDGEYQVVVGNYPETSGQYSLTIDIFEDGETIVHTGYMGDDVNDDYYSVTLEAGQTIQILAEAIGEGSLDTYIVLETADGQELATNDDADKSTYDSYITYTVDVGGTYSVIVSNYPETMGDYRLTIRIDGAPLYGDGTAAVDMTEREIPPDAEVYTGTLDKDTTDVTYEVTLDAGQAVIATAGRVSGDLDTTLSITNSTGKEVAYNDDRDNMSLDSELTFIAPEADVYGVTIGNIPTTSGEFLVTIRVVSSDESRVSFNGEAALHDTPHFRIHYTLTGGDATTEAYVLEVADALEIAYDVQINQLGWDLPPDDGLAGGDSRYDVYLINIEDRSNHGELGYAKPQFPFTDNINTPQVEDYAAASFLVLDNNYTDEWISLDHEPLALMRATAAHEYHHAIQFGYDVSDAYLWYYEATSTWLEVMTFPEDEAATEYVDTLFSYPEVCFGAEGPSDPSGGLLVYGWWLFMESLSQQYGPQIIQELWVEIAESEGWEPLETVLQQYGSSLPDAVRHFHMRNFARDYDMVSSFERDTVWLEQSIGAVGRWKYRGDGVQELGANYFELNLSPGQSYEVNISSENENLELWAFAVRNDIVEVIRLDRGGVVNPTQYKYLYLMVFNPNYDDDIIECHYNDYELIVRQSNNESNMTVSKFSGANFRELRLR